mmetsp:Transcript_43126/g.102369  ORF Transcript_43126/g.102369 Transcript_43126/m.102369 type:complete len:269 (+) Transcript_43126:1730-2536(+)
MQRPYTLAEHVRDADRHFHDGSAGVLLYLAEDPRLPGRDDVENGPRCARRGSAAAALALRPEQSRQAALVHVLAQRKVVADEEPDARALQLPLRGSAADVGHGQHASFPAVARGRGARGVVLAPQEPFADHPLSGWGEAGEVFQAAILLVARSIVREPLLEGAYHRNALLLPHIGVQIRQVLRRKPLPYKPRENFIEAVPCSATDGDTEGHILFESFQQFNECYQFHRRGANSHIEVVLFGTLLTPLSCRIGHMTQKPGDTRELQTFL